MISISHLFQRARQVQNYYVTEMKKNNHGFGPRVLKPGSLESSIATGSLYYRYSGLVPNRGEKDSF